VLLFTVTLLKVYHAVVAGLPSGLSLSSSDIDSDLARRQAGYGRGGRMRVENDRVRILSGGSVKPDNVDELMREPELDGVLVGGAALQAASFLRIVNFRA
jgi:hypothetical protein